MLAFTPLAAACVLLLVAPGCADDDGAARDGGPLGTDGATPTRDGGGGDQADARPRLAEVDLTFSGTCQPRFDGRELVVVADQDSMAIATADQPFFSIQLALEHTGGVLALSSAQRIADGDVINIVSQGTTWTNLSATTPDPIDGQLTITTYRQLDGVVDLTFTGVVLENVQDESLCTVNGRLVTLGTSF